MEKLRDYISFDLEFNKHQDKTHLIQVSAVRFKDGEEVGAFDSYVHTDVPLKSFINGLTGITSEILKDAPMILLDEATASLDVENESLIQEALSELIKEKTVIVIAHRLRTIRNADKIVLLNAGKIEAVGTDSELCKSSEFYKAMLEKANIQ